jgi:hypothetical protein
VAPPSIAPTPRPSKAALKLGVFDESPAPPDPSGRGSRALIIAVVAITLAAVIAIVVLM